MVTESTTKEFTTIQISAKTRDRLSRIADKGETYESVVKKLLELHEQSLIENKRLSLAI